MLSCVTAFHFFDASMSHHYCLKLLCRYALASQHPDFEKSRELHALYIRSKTPWPEVEVFIEECIVRLVSYGTFSQRCRFCLDLPTYLPIESSNLNCQFKFTSHIFKIVVYVLRRPHILPQSGHFLPRTNVSVRLSTTCLKSPEKSLLIHKAYIGYVLILHDRYA